MAKINVKWVDGVIKEIEAIPDCKALENLLKHLVAQMQEQIDSLIAQLEKAAGLALPPTSLPKVIKYLKNLAGKYYAEYIETLQALAEVTAAMTRLLAAIEAKKSSLTCNISDLTKSVANDTLSAAANKPIFAGVATPAGILAAFALVKNAVPSLSVIAGQYGVEVNQLSTVADSFGGAVPFAKAVVDAQVNIEVPSAPVMPEILLPSDVVLPDAAPIITGIGTAGITASSGLRIGGQPLVIVGTGFLANISVEIGSEPCTSIVLVSSTRIECLTPAGNVGPFYDLRVTNADAQTDSISNAYSYT